MLITYISRVTMAGKRILWLFLFCVAALIAVYVGEDATDQSQRIKLDDMAVAENAEAQAKYDLQHHKAKLYIYGLVFEDEMKTRYKNRGAVGLSGLHDRRRGL
jgi:hypothetical protein